MKRRNNAKQEFLERMERLKLEDGDNERDDLEYYTYEEKKKGLWSEACSVAKP